MSASAPSSHGAQPAVPRAGPLTARPEEELHDHVLALALRQRADPPPVADLAARAFSRSQASVQGDAAGATRRLARARSMVRICEGIAVMLLTALIVAGVASAAGAVTVNSLATSVSAFDDTWSEATWVIGAACIAAIAYAVSVRAEPLTRQAGATCEAWTVSA